MNHILHVLSRSSSSSVSTAQPAVPASTTQSIVGREKPFVEAQPQPGSAGKKRRALGDLTNASAGQVREQIPSKLPKTGEGARASLSQTKQNKALAARPAPTATSGSLRSGQTTRPAQATGVSTKEVPRAPTLARRRASPASGNAVPVTVNRTTTTASSQATTLPMPTLQVYTSSSVSTTTTTTLVPPTPSSSVSSMEIATPAGTPMNGLPTRSQNAELIAMAAGVMDMEESEGVYAQPMAEDEESRKRRVSTSGVKIPAITTEAASATSTTHTSFGEEEEEAKLCTTYAPTQRPPVILGGIPQLNLCDNADMMLPAGVVNIDILDKQDPQWATAYACDIYDVLFFNEKKKHAQIIDYLSTTQAAISPSMRGILVDWLVEVAEEYDLTSETLYLSVNFLDRFLSLAQPIDRRAFQLVGVSCMLIAAKYEEICPPALEEFIYIAANTYQREEILQMEILILTTLGFDLTAATCKVFLRRFLKAAEADLILAFLASYLAELSLLEYSLIKYLPSQLAAASVFLALRSLDREPWTATLAHYTQYDIQDPVFQQCVHELYAAYTKAPTGSLKAVYEKYSEARFKSVARLPLRVFASNAGK
eukprot:TRINITY_DN6923_c0_g1_i1.p1 TRINITY_DN6923_c0_g1~~TRINITY_DN6923_c0_g1_i1.p1  ORF type:complete len:596 (+),score=91.88 TRINITY_DN6923_c0_g1_i1:366-2153(+)